MSSSSQSEPASRSFVFMLRNLERAHRYVPPYQQPTPRPPTAVSPRSNDASAPLDTLPAPWQLAVNANGDLIARHQSGHEHILASAPAPETGPDTESEAEHG